MAILAKSVVTVFFGIASIVALLASLSALFGWRVPDFSGLTNEQVAFHMALVGLGAFKLGELVIAAIDYVERDRATPANSKEG